MTGAIEYAIIETSVIPAMLPTTEIDTLLTTIDNAMDLADEGRGW